MSVAADYAVTSLAREIANAHSEWLKKLAVGGEEAWNARWSNMDDDKKVLYVDFARLLLGEDS